MKVAALSSGSDGNCFYLENDSSAILIDAGINAKHTFERLDQLKINPNKIKALFITHEHIDHVRGVDVIARKLNIPIFATNGTIKNGFICSNDSLINKIKNNEIININGMRIEAFSKKHKALDPVSYIISNSNKTTSVITDIGIACNNVNDAISKSNFVFLESNHDIDMLNVGPYPHFLKNWVRGDTGHLSNNQASLAVLEYGHSKLKNVVLSHISKVNNTPSVALNTFNKTLKERHNFDAKVFTSVESSPTQLFRVI